METQKLNHEQYTWLYEIRENTNFYNSLGALNRKLISKTLGTFEYDISTKNEINTIRDMWIRYVKLHNNKTI